MKGIVLEIGSFPPHYVVNVVAIGRVGFNFPYYTGDCSLVLPSHAFSCTGLHRVRFISGSFCFP